MNKLLIGLILALCVPLTAFAEPEMDSGFAEKRAEHLTKALSLNDEQKIKVEAILKGQQEKFNALRVETYASIRAVLTPEQVTKLGAMQEKRQEMRKQRMTNKTK